VRTYETLPSDLLDEYKVCQQKAGGVADTVWKTAIVLGVGSIVGLLAIASPDPIPAGMSPWLTGIVALFAIGLLLSWKGMARRLWAVEHIMLRRMEHIEKMSSLRANLYLAHLDGRADLRASSEGGTFAHPSLDPELLADLEALTKYHHRKGIRAMVDFVIEMNLAAWVAVGFLAAAPFLPAFGRVEPPTIIGPAALVLFLICFVWRFLVHRGKP
jgi:hypothetical protein